MSSPEAQNSDVNNKCDNKWVAISLAAVALIFGGFITLWFCFIKYPTFTLQYVSVIPSNTSASASIGHVSNSSLMVRLSSVNPSQSDMYYKYVAVYLSINGKKKTETALVGRTIQKPKETMTWTFVLRSGGAIAAGAAQGEKATIRAEVPIGWRTGRLHTYSATITVVCPVTFKCPEVLSSSSACQNPKSLIVVPRCSIY